jgi:hypothetical protein
MEAPSVQSVRYDTVALSSSANRTIAPSSSMEASLHRQEGRSGDLAPGLGYRPYQRSIADWEEEEQALLRALQTRPRPRSWQGPSVTRAEINDHLSFHSSPRYNQAGQSSSSELDVLVDWTTYTVPPDPFGDEFWRSL